MNLKVWDVLKEVFYVIINYVEIMGKWYLLVICMNGFVNEYEKRIFIIIVRDVVVVMVMVIGRWE